MNRNLSSAINVIKKGGIAIFPTDTAYGVGCRVDDEKAVAKLFKIRNRPQDKAILVLASSEKMAFEYVSNLNESGKNLARKYWPGGLTIVFDANLDKIPDIVRGNGKTIGIRVPSHATARQLIRRVGVPILAPSANFSGDDTPFNLTQIDPAFIKLVDFVLPGRCTIKKQSTVVDVTGKTPRVLRNGAIKL